MVFRELNNEDAIKIGTNYSYLKITSTKLKISLNLKFCISYSKNYLKHFKILSNIIIEM